MVLYLDFCSETLGPSPVLVGGYPNLRPRGRFLVGAAYWVQASDCLNAFARFKARSQDNRAGKKSFFYVKGFDRSILLRDLHYGFYGHDHHSGGRVQSTPVNLSGVSIICTKAET